MKDEIVSEPRTRGRNGKKIDAAMACMSSALRGSRILSVTRKEENARFSKVNQGSRQAGGRSQDLGSRPSASGVW